jgi:hypothetical protein
MSTLVKAVTPASAQLIRSLLTTKMMQRVQTRSMATEPAAKAAAAAPVVEEKSLEPANKETSVLGISGYSWYPLAGLFAIGQLANENMWLDEHWLLVGCTGLVFWVGYCSVREPTNKYLEWVENVEPDNYTHYFNMQIDRMKAMILLEEFNQSHAADVKNLYDEERLVDELALKYQTLRFRHDVRNSVMTQLSQIKSMEQQEEATVAGMFSATAASFVRKGMVAVSPQVRTRTIDYAIDRIGKNLNPVQGPISIPPLHADDPVYMLYKDFLAKPHPPESLGVKSKIPAYLESLKGKGAKGATPIPGAAH